MPYEGIDDIHGTRNSAQPVRDPPGPYPQKTPTPSPRIRETVKLWNCETVRITYLISFT
jgi:hypothetical protein